MTTEAERVRAMPCITERARTDERLNVAGDWREEGWCSGSVVAAHVTARGMGGRFDIVPPCHAHRIEAGDAGTSQRAAFELRYGLDLRAEADRIALEHPEPLGIRGLVRRWVVNRVCDVESCAGVGCDEDRDGYADLDTYEHEALMVWVRRRMEREVDRRTLEAIADMLARGCDGMMVGSRFTQERADSLERKGLIAGAMMAPHPEFCEYEDERPGYWLTPNGLGVLGAEKASEPEYDPRPQDREALAHAVMLDIGEPLTEDTHGEHGLAWSLCEAAGWPS